MAWEESNGDRRRQPREKVSVAIEVSTPEDTLQARMANISGDGMEVDASVLIEPKTKIRVSIEFNEAHRLNEVVVFEGTVVWALGEYTDYKYIYRMGVQTSTITFRDRTADSFETRAEMVKEILPTLKALEEPADHPLR